MSLEVEKIVQDLKSKNPNRLIIVTDNPDLLVELINIDEEPSFKPEDLPENELIFIANLWLSDRYLPHRFFCRVFCEVESLSKHNQHFLLDHTLNLYAMRQDAFVDRYAYDAANYHTLKLFPKKRTYSR